ncbi:MAG: efflux transporter outer membrane subunit [Acidobacteriaceae bacterium]|jgi:NodT family efflux transporter outer membrane factor (OMF) lipoprotein|nr:efflux transporter outer membrane subunit [Acidobacteriaceae bacterium]
MRSPARALIALAPGLLTLTLTLALTGCAVGQRDLNAHAQMPATPGMGAAVTPTTAADGQQQTFESGAVTPTAWWTTFACPALDTLVTSALAANEDIKIADATLRQSHQLALAAGGALRPQVDASYQPQGARAPESLSPPLADNNQFLYALHTTQVSVSYPVDLFGALKSRARSALAAAEADEFRLLAARQSVAANVANTAITRASLDAQIIAAKDAMTAAQEMLTLMRQRERLGAAGASDVVAQEAALAVIEAGVPDLIRAEAHQRVVLAVLLGLPPGETLPPLPDMSCLHLPSQLPVSLPADIVRNRPDVRAGEATVKGAAADVGAAVAARFPAIDLTAGVGGASQGFGSMFTDGNLFWSLVGSVTAPIFHAGTLAYEQHAAEAALDAAKAQYRSVVLQAFVDVSDALTALHTDADALAAATRGDKAAEQSLTFAERQLALGAIGTFDLLNAQTLRHQVRLQLLQAQTARLSDTVALYQANGAPPDEVPDATVK